MTREIFFGRIEFLIGISLLAWFVYRLWQRLIIDIARHELFKIRNTIFLMAADGELDFNSAEYRDIREVFNGLIRYCHTLTFPKIMAALFLLKPRRNQIAEILSRIDDKKLRTKLEAEWRKAAEILSLSLTLRSPLLLLVIMLTVPLAGALFLLDYPRLKGFYAKIKNAIEHDLLLERYADRPMTQAV